MKIKLNIELLPDIVGDTVELPDAIANQFILKGWAVESKEDVKPEPVKPKQERKPISRKIPKG